MIDAHTRLEAYLRDLYARRPFEGYQDQPDTASRVRRDVMSIEFALPRGGRDADIPYRCAAPDEVRYAYRDACKEPHWLDLVKKPCP